LFTYLSKTSINFEVEIFNNPISDSSSTIAQYFKKICYLSSAKLIVTTHGPVSLRGRKEINTWHSPLFKSILAMENPSQNTRLDTNWRGVDNILSYSKLYSSLMVACTLTNPYRHLITGAPRNDFLFDSDGRRNLEQIIQTNLDHKKIILFVPTFRMGYSKTQGSKNLSNIFGFEEFDAKTFNDFLSNNNILFVYKLHPNEEAFYSEYTDLISPDFSFRLNDQILTENGLDFYEIVNCADILITDYSGIFIDYLLLDRPIIFAPIDLENYTKTRNFLYSPFNEWTPGKKVLAQDELVFEIANLIDGVDEFRSQRRSATNIWHEHQDNKSSERTLKLVENLLNEGKVK
jgi:CDP-glycerol glycerophosphotransferase (TagB/SpsB family)